jgi:DNA-directed RNA polymerase delta subunit
MKKSSNQSIESIARKAFTKNEFTFSDIWKLVQNENLFNNGDESTDMSEFFTELIQNPNFINMGNNKWRLREFSSHNDYQRNKSAMFGLSHLMEKELELSNSKEKNDNDVVEEETIEDINMVDSDD